MNLLVRLIFVPIALVIALPLWIIIGIVNPQGLAKVLKNTSENIMKEKY